MSLAPVCVPWRPSPVWRVFLPKLLCLPLSISVPIQELLTLYCLRSTNYTPYQNAFANQPIRACRIVQTNQLPVCGVIQWAVSWYPISYQVKGWDEEVVSVGEGLLHLRGNWLSLKGYPHPYLAGIWLFIRVVSAAVVVWNIKVLRWRKDLSSALGTGFQPVSIHTGTGHWSM